MNSSRCILALYLLLIIPVFLTLGCQSQKTGAAATKAVQRSDVLRVGVSANAPPLIYKQDRKITGLEASLAAQLGEFLGKEVLFIEVPWEKQLEYLHEGRTDIVMSGMTITRERGYLVDFTKPYLRSGQIMLVRLEDRLRFSTGITSLIGTTYRIGTVRDTVSDLFISASITGANEVRFKTSRDAVAALIKKDIDVFVYDAPIISYYAAIHQADQLVPVLVMGTEEYLGWAVQKHNTELLEQVNNFLETVRKDGRLREEIKFWIPYLYR